jgi:hypothetical protein
LKEKEEEEEEEKEIRKKEKRGKGHERLVVKNERSVPFVREG